MFPDKPVVYVAGNHEFYMHHWTHLLDDMREAARKYDVEYLECDAVELCGIRFLGCTLWTDYELLGANSKTKAMTNARHTMNDFGYIRISRTPEFYWIHEKHLVPDLVLRRHQASREWLELELAKGEPSKTVVVIHHAPSIDSVPHHFKSNMLSAAYASDLSRLGGKASHWLHGHMHSSSDYDMGGTRVVANPRGYKDWRGGHENIGFDTGEIISINF